MSKILQQQRDEELEILGPILTKSAAEHDAYKEDRQRRIATKRRERQRAGRGDVYLREIKERTPCADCGKKFPPAAMDFDHVRGRKFKNLSQMTRCSIKRIAAEVAKCEIVCANCHRIRHASS